MIRVKHIFYVTSLAAASVYLFGIAGLLVAGFISGGWGSVFFVTPKPRGSAGCLIALMLLVLFILMLFPAVQTAHPASRRMQCGNNLKQLCLALHNYHDHKGSFPPAITFDANGKPMHSWRVLLLPYLEQTQLYDDYSMDEAWDGPNNRKLLERMPDVFRCRYQPSEDKHSTGYCVVIGERTCFPPNGSRSLRDIMDLSSDTMMVVEYSPRINWMSPHDPTLEQFKQDVTRRGPDHLPPHYHSDLFEYHYPGCNFGMADGSSRFAGGDRDEALWDTALQIDDGVFNAQQAEKFWDAAPPYSSRTRPEGFVALAAFLVLTFLPAWWLIGLRHIKLETRL